MAAEANPKESKLRSLQTSVGAFGLSLIIHTAVLLLVGSFVVFEGVLPKTPFVAVEGLVGAGDAEVIPAPPEDLGLDVPDTPVVKNDISLSSNSTEAPGEATSSDILVSTGVNMTFSLPPAVGPPTAVPRLGTGTGAAGAGTGGGSGSGTGGPSAGKVVQTLFGSSSSERPVLVGRFYDASRRKNGDPIGIGTMAHFGQNTNAWAKESRGRPSFLRDLYWESKMQLFATQIAIPGGATAVAFESFGEKPTTENPAYLIHYTARIASPEAMTFRFNSIGNDKVIVLIDGKVVSAADVFGGPEWVNNPPEKRTKERIGWESPEPLLFPSARSYNRYTRGDWLTWAANEYHKIDILIGDAAVGGDFYIFIEEQGKKYKEAERTKQFNAHANNQGIPILPLFRVDRGRLPEGLTSTGFLRDVGFEERGPIFLVQ
jgi:hypothetical protein